MYMSMYMLMSVSQNVHVTTTLHIREEIYPSFPIVKLSTSETHECLLLLLIERSYKAPGSTVGLLLHVHNVYTSTQNPQQLNRLSLVYIIVIKELTCPAVCSGTRSKRRRLIITPRMSSYCTGCGSRILCLPGTPPGFICTQ